MLDWIGQLFGGGNQAPKGTTTNSMGQSFAPGYGSSGTSGGGGNFLSKLFGSGGGSDDGGGMGDFLSQIFNPQTILGTGLMGLGMGKKLPEAPELPQSVGNLRNMAQSGGSGIGQQAQQLLSKRMSSPMSEMTEDEEAAILRRFQIEQGEAENRVRDIYRGLGRGEDDSAMERDLLNVQTEFGKRQSDALAEGRRGIRNEYNANQSADIQQSLGASNQEMQMLYQISMLDVYQIAQQLELDLMQAQAFKEQFMSLGEGLITSGLGAQQPMNMFQMVPR